MTIHIIFSFFFVGGWLRHRNSTAGNNPASLQPIKMEKKDIRVAVAWMHKISKEGKVKRGGRDPSFVKEKKDHARNCLFLTRGVKGASLCCMVLGDWKGRGVTARRRREETEYFDFLGLQPRPFLPSKPTFISFSFLLRSQCLT
jgi:hypothetical protein